MTAKEIKLGLWENLGQFSLLVLINAFVGDLLGYLGHPPAHHRPPQRQVGALLAGVLADLLGMAIAIHVVAVLTLVSGLLVALRMDETLRRAREG